MQYDGWDADSASIQDRHSATLSSASEHEGRQVVIAVHWGDVDIYSFKWYVENVHRLDNFVHVCHVPDFRNRLDAEMSAVEVLELMKEINTVSVELKRIYESLLSEYQISGKFVRVGGNNPWCAITEYSRRAKANLIVVGSQTYLPLVLKSGDKSGSGGGGGVEESLRQNSKLGVLGSVTSDVLMHALVPVLVVRKTEEKKALTMAEKVVFWKY